MHHSGSDEGNSSHKVLKKKKVYFHTWSVYLTTEAQIVQLFAPKVCANILRNDQISAVSWRLVLINCPVWCQQLSAEEDGDAGETAAVQHYMNKTIWKTWIKFDWL